MSRSSAMVPSRLWTEKRLSSILTREDIISLLLIGSLPKESILKELVLSSTEHNVKTATIVSKNLDVASVCTTGKKGCCTSDFTHKIRAVLKQKLPSGVRLRKIRSLCELYPSEILPSGLKERLALLKNS